MLGGLCEKVLCEPTQCVGTDLSCWAGLHVTSRGWCELLMSLNSSVLKVVWKLTDEDQIVKDGQQNGCWDSRHDLYKRCLAFKGGCVQHGDASLIIEVLYGHVVALLLAWSEEVRPACHIDCRLCSLGH